MENIWKWFIELPITFGEIADFLGQKIFSIGEFDVSFLGLISGGVIFAIIGAKIVALAIPG